MFTHRYYRFASITTALFLPAVARAAEGPGLGSVFEVLKIVGQRTCGGPCVSFAENLQNDPASIIVGQVISIVLSFLGIILLGLLIYGGFIWMTARGEEEKVEKAKQIITQAIVGIVIIMAAYAVSFFILWSLAHVTTQQLPVVE